MGGARMSAFGDGIRRVNRAPALLAGVWAVTLLVSLPLAAALRGMLAQHLGQSLAADSAASGVNYDWMQEFSEQASGLGPTFKPTIIGFAATFGSNSLNSSRMVSKPLAWPLLALPSPDE